MRAVHIDIGQYSDIYVITNDWHMPRSKAIFDYVFSLPKTGSNKIRSVSSNSWSVSISTSSYQNGYQLHYLAAESGIADKTILEHRIAREKQSLVTFEQNAPTQYRSLQEMHTWLFTQHGAYASSRMSRKDYHTAEAMDATVMQSY